MELADSTSEALWDWALIEFWDRAVAVYPKMSDRLATLLGNLDNLSVTEGEQFVGAVFSPEELRFLRSRALEIAQAVFGVVRA